MAKALMNTIIYCLPALEAIWPFLSGSCADANARPPQVRRKKNLPTRSITGQALSGIGQWPLIISRSLPGSGQWARSGRLSGSETAPVLPAGNRSATDHWQPSWRLIRKHPGSGRRHRDCLIIGDISSGRSVFICIRDRGQDNMTPQAGSSSGRSAPDDFHPFCR